MFAHIREKSGRGQLSSTFSTSSTLSYGIMAATFKAAASEASSLLQELSRELCSLAATNPQYCKEIFSLLASDALTTVIAKLNSIGTTEGSKHDVATAVVAICNTVFSSMQMLLPTGQLENWMLRMTRVKREFESLRMKRHFHLTCDKLYSQHDKDASGFFEACLEEPAAISGALPNNALQLKLAATIKRVWTHFAVMRTVFPFAYVFVRAVDSIRRLFIKRESGEGELEAGVELIKQLTHALELLTNDSVKLSVNSNLAVREGLCSVFCSLLNFAVFVDTFTYLNERKEFWCSEKCVAAVNGFVISLRIETQQVLIQVRLRKLRDLQRDAAGNVFLQDRIDDAVIILAAAVDEQQQSEQLNCASVIASLERSVLAEVDRLQANDGFVAAAPNLPLSVAKELRAVSLLLKRSDSPQLSPNRSTLLSDAAAMNNISGEKQNLVNSITTTIAIVCRCRDKVTQALEMAQMNIEMCSATDHIVHDLITVVAAEIQALASRAGADLVTLLGLVRALYAPIQRICTIVQQQLIVHDIKTSETKAQLSTLVHELACTVTGFPLFTSLHSTVSNLLGSFDAELHRAGQL